MTAQAQAEQIIADFAFFDDWQERYQHLIDLGRRCPPLDPAHKVEANRLMGCQSLVYFKAEYDGGVMRFYASSDAAIVQGLIALMVQVYSGQTPQDILATPPEFLREIGLDAHLSATRKNGLAALVGAIMTEARQALAQV